MRVLFAGSPEITVPAMAAVVRDHDLVGVLTNPQAPKGRGLRASPTPVARAAADLVPGVPILEFERLGPEARQAVAALNPEILVCFAYGRIFGPRFLALFPWGGINVHPSLLPKYRGCAPIPCAILNRESETGITVQRLAPRMDSGAILAREVIPLYGRETAESLSGLMAELGADILASVLARIEQGEIVEEEQDEGRATYCSILRKEDGRVDWASGVLDIDARIRAFHPWPGAYTELRGRRVNLLDSMPYPDERGPESPGGLAKPGTVVALDRSRGIMIQTGDGLLALRRLQFQTKKPMPFLDFANGVRDIVGTRFL
ncbi:MAG TPA: methionyl-tRNA formyltransferase [Magnetospirillaceae bacterium]|nr:methionyl-tRNA formyltransferase [Magnetospirillaceae bacterium]